MTQHPQGGTSPATMLSDAIGRVAILEQKATELTSDVSEMGATVADTARAVSRIEGDLAALATRGDSGDNEEEEDTDDDTIAPDWSRLDQHAARQEWQRLERWLADWLVPTYEITLGELPPCWQHHPAIREELSWLRASWAAVYRGSGSGAQAGEWHTRWLPAAISRMQSHARRAGCTSAGKHRGSLLSESARDLTDEWLAYEHYWDTEGKEIDIAARPLPSQEA